MENQPIIDEGTPATAGHGPRPRPQGATGTATQAEAATDDSTLFVDLDGSLTSGDLLAEGLLRAVREKPLLLWNIFSALGKGRAQLKDYLAHNLTIDAASLPYRPQVLELLRRERERGRRLVLATASPRTWADAVAAHLGLFHDTLASDATQNLKGPRKLASIQQYLRDEGLEGFSYVGDAHADLPIWGEAKTAYVVAPSTGLLKQIEAEGIQPRVIGEPTSRGRAIWKALRPHQWVKNVLIFVPLVTAQSWGGWNVLYALLAFIAFSLCASAVYVVNDLVDVRSDRLHASKRRRPFAAGTLPLAYGPPLAVGLVTIGLGLSLAVHMNFTGILLLYLLLTSLYSFWLKRQVILDVVMLASLYTLRIFAGAVAISVPVSEWLMAFSMFIFASLAFAKRYVELARLGADGGSRTEGRGYLAEDLDMVHVMGPACGFISVMVLALYVSSEKVAALYEHPQVLWLLCPLMMYAIGRIWILTRRGVLTDDPIVFAVRDRVCQLTVVAIGVIMLVANWKWGP